METKQESFEPLEKEYEFNADCRQLRFEEHRRLKAGCELLHGQDKALMELYLKGDVNYQKLAALLGQSKSTVVRKIRQLLKFLLAPPSDKQPHRARQIELAVARWVKLERMSLEKISIKTGLTKYEIRCICKKMGILPAVRRTGRKRCVMPNLN